MTKRKYTSHVAAAAVLFALLLQASILAIAVSKPIVIGTQKLNNVSFKESLILKIGGTKDC